MKHVIGRVLGLVSCGLILLPFASAWASDSAAPAPAAKDESCDCDKLACDACSVQQSLTFFTRKCGPRNSRLKSCARPTCVPIDEATKECPNPPMANSGPREPVVVRAAGASVESADPAADIKLVGTLKVLTGKVTVVHLNGRRVPASGEMRVRESDTIESAADSTGLVTFDGGNKLHIHPETVIQIKEYADVGDPSSRKALLQLIKGKIRNQVEQKYNGKTSYYRVFTTAAVAGVRGTDFVMEHNEDKTMETKVEGLQGHVVLASLDEKQVREILRGEGASFTLEMPDPSFKDKDIAEFIQRGKMSPVYKIDGERLAELDFNSRVDISKTARSRRSAKKASDICDKPKGEFNQCAWQCTGNPAGERTCRTDLPGVACVRTRCNGNGKWAEETRLPASSGQGVCPANGHSVKSCDY